MRSNLKRTFSWLGYTIAKSWRSQFSRFSAEVKTCIALNLGCLIFLLLSLSQPILITPIGIFSKHYQCWTIQDEKNWPKGINSIHAKCILMIHKSWYWMDLFWLSQTMFFLGSPFQCFWYWQLFQRLSSACLNKIWQDKIRYVRGRCKIKIKK